MQESTEHTAAVVGIRHAPEERGIRQRSYRPLREHVGPFHRNLHAGKDNLSHQREMYHCSSNPAKCPACYADALDGYQARVALLSMSGGYLEVHIVETEREVENLQTAVRRRTNSEGALVTIPVKDNKFYVVTPIRLRGRKLPVGEERVAYLNRLAEKGMKRPRKKGEHALRFNHSWPHIDEAPKKFDRIGSSPDCAKVDPSDDELIEQSVHALKTCRQRSHTGIVFNPRTGGGVRTLDFWVPLEVLAEPRRHVCIHLALGYHLSPVFYERSRRWAECELRKRAESRESAA